MPERTSSPKPSLALVVLAAGKGKRLKSDLPKVLHPLCGRPALWWVLRTARAARPDRIVVVVHHGADDVRAAVARWGISPKPVFVEQGEVLGTGHAVLAAERAVGRSDEVLVANGDLDPVTEDDVRALLRLHRRTRSAASVIVTEVETPGGYARVVREGDRLVSIAEGTDAPPELREVNEIGTNWIAFRREDLFRALPLVGRDNSQGEHYLNDVYAILMDKGERLSVLKVDTGGAMGINSRSGLAQATRVLRDRINARHLANGVTLVDPATAYIDVDAKIGRDTVIHPMTFLAGETAIAAGCEIGPSTRIVDSRVGTGAVVQFSVVREARIGAGAQVGPYAHVRPGTMLGPRAKVGAYVEVKASEVGEGAKVPHLSYVGDAKVGRRANVGAGTVTVNYDGYEKHRTVIGDDARVGSDTMLVAPVTVGKGAVTGAGSVITDDVPAGALAVERSEQRIVKGYRKRKDAEVETRGQGAKATRKRSTSSGKDKGAR
ncbi:MAG TPA: bifunctional UDP-N-acetylglucosamine diphosphorylase/glucosamine-1-phosphate N-acetyltransferase GlmU [Actinomycetota bacterium]|nr:bifunctional UDP-N-acetylglucosamine diphosphorylase/glucosamine-1-phosphate N-acetyltransferase GlmU [Actinomycetota bacterium]